MWITRVQRSNVISLLHMSATVLKEIFSSRKIVTLKGLSNNTKRVSRLSVEQLYWEQSCATTDIYREDTNIELTFTEGLLTYN